MSEASHKLTKERIDHAIYLCKSYSETRKSQMQRGLNDFNVFTCLLEEHDEVRLHSRFIHSLLNINGDHGQGDFFLGLFLQKCGLDDVGMNTKNCRVYKEYNNIDLYITDGSRHIIIENKIYAGPQDRQIERYIEIIKEENRDDDLSESLVVVYLSLDRDGPHEDSLGKYKIIESGAGKEIVDKATRSEKYRFLSIHYDKEILGWIQSCKTQVSNITNLFIGLTQYEEVILSLYGRKEDKLMNLKEYIKDHKNNEPAVLRDLREVKREYPPLRESYIEAVVSKSAHSIKEKILPYEDWEVELKTEYSPKKGWTPVTIKKMSTKPEQSLAFYLQFDARNGYCPFYGISGTGKDEDAKRLKEWCKTNNTTREMLEKITLKLDEYKNSRWIGHKYYHGGDDMFDFIIDKGGVDAAAREFADKFMDLFENYKEFVKECNKLYLSHTE